MLIIVSPDGKVITADGVVEVERDPEGEVDWSRFTHISTYITYACMFNNSCGISAQH